MGPAVRADLDQHGIDGVGTGAGHQTHVAHARSVRYVARYSKPGLFAVAAGEARSADGVQPGGQRGRVLPEGVAVGRRNQRRRWRPILEWIDVLAVDAEFVMQVRAGGQAGCPHVGDDLPLLHVAADAQLLGVGRQVGVQRGVRAGMFEDDAVAITAVAADGKNTAVGGGAHRRAARRRVVDAAVRTPAFQDRMEAVERVAGADAREFHRCAQVFALHAAAFRRVVLGDAALIAVGDGAVDAPVADELGRENDAVADLLAAPVFFLVHNAEAIAAAQVEREIDVPAEDLDQLEDHGVGQARVLTVLEQAGFDGPGDVGDAGLKVARESPDIEAVGGAGEAQFFLQIRAIGEFHRAAGFIDSHPDDLSRPELIERACERVIEQGRKPVIVIQPVTPDQRLEGIATSDRDFLPLARVVARVRGGAGWVHLYRSVQMCLGLAVGTGTGVDGGYRGGGNQDGG